MRYNCAGAFEPTRFRSAAGVSRQQLDVPGALDSLDRLTVGWLSPRGAARAENAQGKPTQSHMSPSILVYEDEFPTVVIKGWNAPGALHSV